MRYASLKTRTHLYLSNWKHDKHNKEYYTLNYGTRDIKDLNTEELHDLFCYASTIDRPRILKIT